MFGAVFIMTLIGNIIQLIEGLRISVIPTENWANKELYYRDMIDGVSVEDRLKNVKNGKYKLRNAYPKPHRDIDGKIIIENSQLYHNDVMNYGAYKACQWAEQGKYNLSAEEFKKEKERIKKKYNIS